MFRLNHQGSPGTPAICPVSGQTAAEELANWLSHLLGLLLGVVGTVVLVTFASLWGNAWHIVSFSVFGGSLVLLYSVSVLYHLTRHQRRKRLLQIIDHVAIFLLIGGSYTPFTLVTLNGSWGWSIFGVVWGLALAGIIIKIFFTGRFEVASTVAYIGLGWLVLIAIGPLVQALGTGGLVWLFLGGVSYTLGALFYLWERLPFNHAIWHLFVIGGAVCHFFAILFHVLRIA